MFPFTHLTSTVTVANLHQRYVSTAINVQDWWPKAPRKTHRAGHPKLTELTATNGEKMCTVGILLGSSWFLVGGVIFLVLYGCICMYVCVPRDIGSAVLWWSSGQEVWLFGGETYVLSLHSDFRMVPLKKVKNLEDNLAPIFEETAALGDDC